MKLGKVDVSLQIGLEQDFDIATCRVEEGLSELTHAAIEITTGEHVDLDTLLEADAKVIITFDGDEVRRWTLRLGMAHFVGHAHGTFRYQLDLYPALWFAQLSTNTRKFRNMSAEQIVSKVLGELGVAHVWEHTRPTAPRKYCVQYQESNLAFVSRLLEFEGIYYYFAPDGVVHFADTSGASPFVEPDSHYELLGGAGAMLDDEVGIHAIKKTARVRSGMATVNDFNWKTPAVKLIKSASADLDTELEVYDYPVGYRKPEQGDVFARIRMEAFRPSAKTLSGRASVVGFMPARIFEFGGLANPSFAGEWLLQRVVHTLENPTLVEKAGGTSGKVGQTLTDTIYANDFVAIPRSVPFRPPLVTAHPHIAGCHTAMVRGPEGEEIHTDKYGRFRAQFHWDREATGTDEDSRWVRNLQETQTGMVLARVGWEYSMAYIDGDPDRPIGFARNINGEMVPEYGLPANKTRMTIKTPTYPSNGGFNELRLEDIAGAQEFFMKAERDMANDVNNDRNEVVGNNELHKIASGYSHAVQNDQSVTIGSNLKLHTKKSQPIHVTQNRDISVGGNETIEVSSSQVVNTLGNETETVGGNRDVSTGKEANSGAIARTVKDDLTRSVGSVDIQVGVSDIQLQIGGKFTEKIGGARLSAVKGNVLQNVAGPMTTTVGGAILRLSEGDQGYSGKNSYMMVGVTAGFESAEKLTVQSKHIVITGFTDLTMTSKSLEIAMTPGQIAMKGQILFDSGSNIVVTGGPDNLTK